MVVREQRWGVAQTVKGLAGPRESLNCILGALETGVIRLDLIYIIYLSSNQGDAWGWGGGRRGFLSALQGESDLRGSGIIGGEEMGKVQWQGLR